MLGGRGQVQLLLTYSLERMPRMNMRQHRAMAMASTTSRARNMTREPEFDEAAAAAAKPCKNRRNLKMVLSFVRERSPPMAILCHRRYREDNIVVS